MADQTIKISKFLSLILRHRPELLGMTLDEEGWLPIDELIRRANEKGERLTLELLHEVVTNNDKQRFSLSEDGLYIRANQGHSVRHVDLNLSPVAPPQKLFHGTVSCFIDGIRQKGLIKRSRNHVHLSADEPTAIKVALRRGEPILLVVDAFRMHQQGHHFYLSANGVWLADAVPVEFIQFP